MRRAEWGALIVDDEPAARRGVRQLLAAFPDFAVVGECRNGAELLATLDIVRPHVVFLDVQMPGIDGFEAIRRRTPEQMPAVVFLTAYDQFAIQAFEAEALDYLLKPVSEARFAATISRVVKRLRSEPASHREPGLVVATLRGAIVLPLREIDWIEAADNYARVWVGARNYLHRESLRELEARVGGQGFIRAHRRALVRIAGVREVTWTGADEFVAVLDCGVKIPVSRRRRAVFIAALRSHR